MSNTMDVAIGRRSNAPLIGFAMVTLVVAVLAVGIASMLTEEGALTAPRPAIVSEQFSNLDRDALVAAGYTGRLGAATSTGESVFSDAIEALRGGRLLARAYAEASRYHAAVVAGNEGQLAALTTATPNRYGGAADARIGGRPGRQR